MVVVVFLGVVGVRCFRHGQGVVLLQVNGRLFYVVVRARPIYRAHRQVLLKALLWCGVLSFHLRSNFTRVFRVFTRHGRAQGRITHRCFVPFERFVMGPYHLRVFHVLIVLPMGFRLRKRGFRLRVGSLGVRRL